MNYIDKNHLRTAVPVIFSILLIYSGCTERVEVKREWPMPLKLNTGVIKQCNMIHNRTCPDNRAEMTNAVYYFDKRKLPEVIAAVKNSAPSKKNRSEFDRLVFRKKIESSKAYKATFLRSSCSIEYYINGKNVTCEKFIDYIDTIKKECPDCIEEIIVDDDSVTMF